MPFSHESLKAKEEIEKELREVMTINSIVEIGIMNDYLSKKYFQFIKNNDEFEKICCDLMLKNGYKILKTGSGMYFTNPHRYSQDNAIFNFSITKCPLCQEELPDIETL